MENNFITVTEVNRYIAYKFDQDASLKNVAVEGELSNVKKSGNHYYFSLKDEGSEITAMFFYPLNLNLKFVPRDGMKVQVKGKIGVYQKRGTYSINVTQMEECGLGLLYQQFLELKDKLQKEGLFDEKYKLPIPDYPECVGIITAPTGEAINDIVSTFERRFPLTKLKLFPSLVQGIDAPKDLVRALNLAYQDPELNCIIIGRGGGSFEDLNAFNDEILARTLFSSKIPTISAVGHEGDYSICDFVASFRAPTPTGAAMRLTKVKEEVMTNVLESQKRLVNAIKGKLINCYNDYKRLSDNYYLAHFDEVLENKYNDIINLENKLNLLSPDKLTEKAYESINQFEERLNISFNHNLTIFENDFERLVEKCELVNPLSIIKKGYSVVFKDNKVVSSIKNINPKDDLDIKLSDGTIKATVVELKDIEGE